jgi:orotate phosphoribosyltransferase
MKRDAQEHGLLLGLLQKASKTGEFTLSSGMKSDWYLDCREVTTTHCGLKWVANEILEMKDRIDFNVLGGPASAAVASMAGAVALGPNHAHIRSFVYTREKAKEHGTQQQVDGAPLDVEKDKVLLVDDVLTSGGSLLKCRDALLAKYPDLNIVGAWVLVDRADGGRDRLMQEGLRVFSAFTRLDILAKV